MGGCVGRGGGGVKCAVCEEVCGPHLGSDHNDRQVFSGM